MTRGSDISGAEPPAGQPTERVLTGIAVLLTFASGASDVASYTRLGGVFTSVMTGNMVVLGLSLARGSAVLATHTVTSVAGYALGVVAGTRIAWYRAAGKTARDDTWPPHITLALLAEFVLVCGVAAGWELTGSRPAGAVQFIMLVIAAAAMGIQSSTVNQMGLGNVSTTYLTGTLTGLVTVIARPDGTRPGLRRPGVLAGLLLGAVLAGVLVAFVPAAVPALPLLAVGTATALASGPLRR
ncbi:MAG: DUF1275 domain-containing protein [Streptosporangiales bacterium]|nr:DUF1275 domain-containing protein [Streptosporangiales bacterium]